NGLAGLEAVEDAWVDVGGTGDGGGWSRGTRRADPAVSAEPQGAQCAPQPVACGLAVVLAAPVSDGGADRPLDVLADAEDVPHSGAYLLVYGAEDPVVRIARIRPPVVAQHDPVWTELAG